MIQLCVYRRYKLPQETSTVAVRAALDLFGAQLDCVGVRGAGRARMSMAVS
jgi:hypothetical protein